MPKLPPEKLPAYRHHRASGQAIVPLSGKDFYLGSRGTEASKREYDRLTAAWLAAGRRLPDSADELTISELLLRYWDFAEQHYRKDGRPTHELVNIRSAIRPLKQIFGRLAVRAFGPPKLKALQSCFVSGYKGADGKLVKGLCRRTANARIGTIKRVFAWAVSEELAPPSTAHALAAVRGLQRGRTDARESPPVQPVDDATIDATLQHLPPVVADMVRFQHLVGCRPGEVFNLRPCDVDRTAKVWIYRPVEHKMQHHGRDRLIFIGPRAQKILKPYLKSREATAPCFSPAESELARKRQLREARRTKVQPSQFDRSKARPRIQPGQRPRDR